MKASKLAGYLAGMTLMGAVAFAALGWAVQAREGQAIAPPAQAARIAGDRLTLLAQGAAASTDQARRDLREERRSKAVHALDAASRASMAGMQATHGETSAQFKQAHEDLKQARQALQNGNDVPEALSHLDAALAALKMAAHTRNGLDQGRRELDSYVGAQVINAQGVRLGEVESVRSDAGGAPQVVLALGHAQNVLGVLDFGGQRVSVPADQLLLGKPKWLGATQVVVPSLQADIGQVVAELEGAGSSEYARGTGAASQG